MTKKARKTPAPSIQTAPKKVARKPKPPPGADPLVRMLPCPLTEAERNERAMKAVELGSSIEREIAEVAERNTLSRKILRGLRDDAHRYQQEALDGVELRPVPCEEHVNVEHLRVDIVRSDTKRFIEVLRDATPDELSGNLFGDK
jgi:hypothetical protein